MTIAEDQVLQLCENAIASTDPEESSRYLTQLRSMLREQSLSARNELAFLELHQDHPGKLHSMGRRRALSGRSYTLIFFPRVRELKKS